MYERFTDRSRKVMQLANQEAQRFNHEYIGTEHILLGLVREGSGVAAAVLKNLQVDLTKIRQEVEKSVVTGPDVVVASRLPQTPKAKKVIEHAIEEARSLGHDHVGTEHLLLGLLREEDGVAAQVLVNLGLNLSQVREALLILVGPSVPRIGLVELPSAQTSPLSRTPALDCFGRDLTALARQSTLDPVVARSDELHRVIRILCRRSRSNPLLLGESGVGKTALVAGLAQQIAAKLVPASLADRRIIQLDRAALVAGARLPGQLEERCRAVRNEVSRADNVILFLDDLHLWARHRQLLPQLILDGGDESCIAATTREGRALLEERVPSMMRSFQPLGLAPLSREGVLAVLLARRESYETYHHVVIQEAALNAAVDLAARRGTEGMLDLSLSVIDEAAAEVCLRNHPPTLDVTGLEAQMERLHQEKEVAVEEQNFDRAAHLRDQVARLKRNKESLMREWQEMARVNCGVVDEATVTRVFEEIDSPCGVADRAKE